MAKIDVKFEPTHDLTVFTVKGSMSVDDVLDFPSEYYNAYPTQNVMWDVTKGTFADIESRQVPVLAAEMAKFTTRRSGGRTAFVLSQDVDYGLVKMYLVHARFEHVPITYKIFRDVPTARAWLLDASATDTEA